MGRFDRQIATAQRLIKKNGETVKWNIVRDGDPVNEDQPWKPTSIAPDQRDAIICFLPINIRSDRVLSLMQQSEVPICSEMGLMGAVDFEPNLKDVVIRNGKEYRIADMDILRPNGQNILYTVYFQA